MSEYGEPWSAEERLGRLQAVVDCEDRTLIHDVLLSEDAEERGIAQRIALCVTFCASLSNAALEATSGNEMRGMIAYLVGCHTGAITDATCTEDGTKLLDKLNL